MTDQLLPQLWRMAQAWSIVAGPIALLAIWSWRSSTRPIGWRPDRGLWTTLDVPLVLAFAIISPAIAGGFLKEATWWKPAPELLPITLLEPLAAGIGSAAAVPYVHDLQENHALALWGKIFGFLGFLGIVAVLLQTTDRQWPSLRCLPLVQQLALATLVWLIATPLVILLNFACNVVLLSLGQTPEVHPLTLVGVGQTVPQQLLFFGSACLAAPLLEEFTFRGVLTPWAIQSRLFPWLLLLLAAIWGTLLGPLTSGQLGPILYLILSAIGLGLLQQFGHWGRVPTRTAGAIWASSAFFGAIHFNVWPTPIPLFLLGLALGYLGQRTGSWLTCGLVHGAFNAISALFLLLGSI